MFQTSSSAIVHVTFKFLQDNSYTYIDIYIYIYIYNDSLFINCSLQCYREHN